MEEVAWVLRQVGLCAGSLRLMLSLESMHQLKMMQKELYNFRQARTRKIVMDTIISCLSQSISLDRFYSFITNKKMQRNKNLVSCKKKKPRHDMSA